nr:nuclear transport factor 2 family protein [Pseudonocardia dioxanivorans]
MSTDPRGAVAACSDLVVSYHRAIDTGRATDGISAFAPEAEFTAKGRVMRGHDEILDFLADRERQVDRQTVHVIANEKVLDAIEERVELGALILLYVRGPAGDYVLERVLETRHTFGEFNGTWLITRRTSSPLHSPEIERIP